MVMAALIDFYVGTYTSPGGSEGIYKASLNTVSGELSAPTLFAKQQNPSYLARLGKTILAVQETANGKVYSYTESGSLSGENSTGGDYPCHISLTDGGKTMLVANYNKGVVAKFKLAPRGAIQQPSYFTNSGSGPNKQRQDASHMHFIAPFMKDWNVACDLGTDELLSFEGADFTTPKRFKLQPGAGPRHATFLPSKGLVFVNNELDCTVTSLKADTKTGEFSVLNTLSSLPSGTGLKGNSTAEIRTNGRFVFVTNRGHHSIASYKIEADGRLKLIEIKPAEVKTPRGMNLDPSGKWLVVAGQDSNDVRSFKVGEDGKLTSTGHMITVSKPVDILF
jgi:6-phosphogluconolactonase